tara:strand:+ start:2042 stop:2593 length:552 start_codon:yes stop_codon:yes gene_type:complete
MSKIALFNKPFNVLCQFTDSNQNGTSRQTLADFIRLPNFYPAGRLDKDSEGLLLLTDDGQLQNRIAHPKMKMPKSYWVQVEGEIDSKALEQLQTGIRLNDGMTLPATAKLISEPDIWLRTPPIRQRQHIPTSWLSLTIHEGRNRQVRRMTAALGYPTLRLIRYQIGPWNLDTLAPGEYKLLKL